MASPDPIDALLGAALRAEPAPWPEAWSSDAAEAALLEHADYHGVASLVLPAAARWPAPVREALRSRAMLRAAWELQHRARLLALLAELEARGAASLFLKGTALAYSVYDQPAQRQRADSDLLVAKSDIEAARAALAAAGFARPEADAQASGALQESWTVVEAGFHHTIDLHWAVFNTPRLAAVLPAEACDEAALAGFLGLGRATDGAASDERR